MIEFSPAVLIIIALVFGAAWYFFGSRRRDEDHMDKTEPLAPEWERLLSRREGTAVSKAPAAPSDGTFDRREFLKGAKLLFTRLVEAADPAEREELSGFVDPTLLPRLKNLLPPYGSQVLFLEAAVKDIRSDEAGGRNEVRAAFSARIKPDSRSADERRVDQEWTFVRRGTDPSALWRIVSVEQSPGG